MVQKEPEIRMGKKNHELIPSARRLISSLRDMGYDFPAAVADIVDNSIEAGAGRVSIDIRNDGDDSWVRICDDGRGMKPAQVREALRYGSTGEYDQKKSLGKFGLGLKTASMSQCQHLLLASRSNPNQPQICAYAWDLAHIVETDTWEILDVGREEHTELLREPLLTHTGTVVLWRRLDRILGLKHPYSGMIKKRILAMCSELEEHLAMVFHRYLSGEAGRRKVRISVNGRPLRPWDPFVRAEKSTARLEPVVLQYDHDGIKGSVLMEPYVLPHQDEFSSPEAHAAAAGSLRWNRQQGFYIYRADRMVQSGGWSNLRTLDEHTKLARVALRFDPCLDDAFRINVAKMRVQLPRQLCEGIEKAIAPVVKAAQVAYRRSNGSGHVGTPIRNIRSVASVEPVEDAVTVPQSVSGGAKSKSKSERLRVGARLWTIEELRDELMRIATKQEQKVVLALINRLSEERELSDELLLADGIPSAIAGKLDRHSVQ
jgi:Histidine kinase-, DNA gyrase B-, and HSP90-like ATPase